MSSTHATVAVSSSTGPDIGVPSDTYPAPHPAQPSVEDLGGPVLTAPVFVPVFFKDDDTTTMADMTKFLGDVGGTAYWTATTSEYGVGPGMGVPAVVVQETPTGTIDDSAIQTWLEGKLNGNDPLFPAPTANTIYAIYYPPGVDITLSDGQGGVEMSCFQFGAYHNSITLDANHGSAQVAYAVMPRCMGFGQLSGMDALSAPTSHELIEAVTDPFPDATPAFAQEDPAHVFWSFAIGGGEVGDMCAQYDSSFEHFPGIDYAAQRTWSNKSAAASHDPCVPVDAGEVYFNAAPVLTDALDLGGGFNTKGVKIPVNQSKTIDVKLFSDGPTDPFEVDAFEPTQETGGPYLTLDLDASQGQNGQTLHLTITVNSASGFNAELFMLRATNMNTMEHHDWVGLVGN